MFQFMPVESLLKQSAQSIHLLCFYFGEDSERETHTHTNKQLINFEKLMKMCFSFAHWGGGDEGVFICFVFLLSGDNGENNEEYPRRGRKLKTNIKASASSKLVGLTVAL